jgi:hypothetical protein
MPTDGIDASIELGDGEQQQSLQTGLNTYSIDLQKVPLAIK